MTNITDKSHSCSRCKKIIGRVVMNCKICLKDFHPGCADSNCHKIYDINNQLVRCNGPYTTYEVQLNEDKESRDINNSNTDQVEKTSVNNSVIADIHNDNNTTDILMSKVDSLFNKIDIIHANNISCLKEIIKNEIKDHVKHLTISLQQTVHKNLYAMNSKNSYSEITQKNPVVSNVDRLVVKPNKIQDTEVTVKDLKNNIDIVKLGVDVKKVTNQSNGKVIIDTVKEADKIKLMNEIQNKIGIKLENSILGLSEEKIIRELSTQNKWINSNGNNPVKVIKKYETANGYGSIIIEVSTSIHQAIMNSGKVKFGWNLYNAYNHINILRCFRCWGFGHLANNCKKEEICRLCSTNHHETECQSESNKCINCVELVNKYKLTDIDINHCATDRNSVNICGLVNRKDEIDIVINEIKPDIICLCETHTTDDVSDYEIEFKNYNMIRTNTNNRRTGGTITYVIKNIKYKVILNSNDIIDGSWINCIQFCNGNEKLVLCNLYRSPSSSINIFCDKILEIAEQIMDTGKLIMLGDFNIDVRRNDFYARKLTDEMSYLGLKQNIETPTRLTFDSQTIIDLVFTNFKIKSVVMTTPKVSDHNIIYIQIDGMNDVDSNTIVYSRDFKHFNDEVFQTEVLNKFDNWQTELCINNNNNDCINFNLTVERISSSVLDVLDKMAPFKEKIINYKWINKPWIDNKAIEMIKNKDESYRVAMKSKDIAAINNYKLLRNKVVNELRTKKKQYYENNISINKNNPHQINYDNSCNKTSEKINEEQSIIKWETFDEVEFNVVDKIINNLDTKKGSKNDVNANILKLVWDVKSDVIIYMINNSLKLGLVPSIWKISTVTPIQKELEV
ncbi:uncharacterized protein LOC130676884 [Microplitis mediator]|uniref:uncharacterized protein LOC130676884 n=1 Tax=Microplitis mediator TaxID=375433 RepID=UPI002555DD3C|nr:uncharacterized protein LOC130676884 [Microplitis mediator]